MTVEVPVVRTERVQLPPATPRNPDWVPLLAELARQLETGRIYCRDMPVLTGALEQVIAAINRRSHTDRR